MVRASTEPRISTLLSNDEPAPVPTRGDTQQDNSLFRALDNSQEITAETAQENVSKASTSDPTIKSKTPRRVKVYLLDGDDWLDNGTGYCMGEFDLETQKPYFIVRNELDTEDIILMSYLEGSIQYQRQQETLIVWTDLSGKDLALSFQENAGCADLCEFIVRVQQQNLSPQISLYYVLPMGNGLGQSNDGQNAEDGNSGSSSSFHSANSASEGPREVTELITGPVTYPAEQATKESLKETLELITKGYNSMYTRYKLLAFLVTEHYFDKLFTLFLQLEESRDLESLHCLNDIMKIVLYYNEPKIVEELLSSEFRAMGLIGVLEYDREFPEFKACHREYLQDESRLKTVIEIPLPKHNPTDPMDIFKKDFVLQYLKNVVLAQTLEDLALNLLASMIHNNQIDIIDYLKDSQANNDFLPRLFSLYDSNRMAGESQNLQTSDSSEPPDEALSQKSKRYDGVRMLHQYVLVAKNNLSEQSTHFFSSLVKHGLLKMIKFALGENDSSLRVVGVEILTTIIEQDVSLVKLVYEEKEGVDEIGDLVQAQANGRRIENEGLGTEVECRMPQSTTSGQQENSEAIKLDFINDMSLTMVLGNLLYTEKNPALKLQAFDALKSLLSSTVFDLEFSRTDSMDEGAINEEKYSAHEMYIKHYFEAFYRHAAPILFKTFMDLANEDTNTVCAAEKSLQNDPILYQHLCDLISFCCNEHESSICRPFFTKSHAFKGILKVLTLDVHVTLKLGVLRCFKGLILLDDPGLCRYIVENKLFDSFFTYFSTISESDSLANSLCLDVLEIILRRCIKENFGFLVVHLSQNYRSFLQTKVSYVSTGNDLLVAAKQLNEKSKDITVTSVDVDQEYMRTYNPHPSSPISQEFVGRNEETSHVNGSLQHDTKKDSSKSSQVISNESLEGSAEHEDLFIKRKLDCDEPVVEKRNCVMEREDCGAAIQEDVPMEEEKGHIAIATP